MFTIVGLAIFAEWLGTIGRMLSIVFGRINLRLAAVEVKPFIFFLQYYNIILVSVELPWLFQASHQNP